MSCVSLTPLDKKLKQKSQRLFKTYGLSLNTYNKMLNDQRGVCWICQTLPPSGRLNVDHMHVAKYKQLPPEEKIQYVRGLLCFNCNTTVGKLERTNNKELNRKRLNGLIEYFKVFKMKGEL